MLGRIFKLKDKGEPKGIGVDAAGLRASLGRGKRPVEDTGVSAAQVYVMEAVRWPAHHDCGRFELLGQASLNPSAGKLVVAAELRRLDADGTPVQQAVLVTTLDHSGSSQR
jgi:hypothetical protein